ncbi:MAG: HAMP domain-containing protein [Sandaracinaceae bacterium]|jgi:signal transduction histidine kinase/HAMP domain-containing protein|nr:HAMP domain-containing protein [Sandaracinaceae bacterium]MBK8407451.1 HAMP domain-containing protein [Sandaracinaceae bacterium]MBK8590736.1 HAMP domain-containing protein [Sandaracinaceae bacterium]MBP7680387.1 HAMP domain-containing protein [Deltaproteobacteria bacterium]
MPLRSPPTQASSLRRPSIPTRIFLGFALVLTAFGAVAIFSLTQHARTVRTLGLLNEGLLPLALTLGEAKATQAVFATLLNQIESEDAVSRRGWLNAARAVRPATLRRAFHGLDRAEQLAVVAGGEEALARVRASLNDVSAAYRASDADYEALEAAHTSGDPQRAERMLRSMRLRERDVQRHYRDGWRELQEAIASTSSIAAEHERRASIVLGVLVLLSLSLGVLVTWWSQRILKPIPALQERVEAVARGDLSTTLDLGGDDELGRLAAAFDRMVKALALRDASLRELQQMQREIVEGLRAAVVVVDTEGLVRVANPAARDLLRVATEQRAEESLGAVPGLLAAIEQVRTTDQRVALGRVNVARGTQEVVLDVSLAPFGRGEEGASVGSVLVVVEDVTDELATAARLIQTERLAAIGRMAAHVTHEVRNPLSSIGLNVELLEEELVHAGPEAAALLASVQQEVDRLTGITEQYLRLSRVPQPQLEPGDLGRLVRDIAAFMAEEMRAHGSRLVVELAEPLPQVALDAGQLRQALLNLLRNAREAMPGGGEVHVSVQPAAPGVRLTVRDHGSGISDSVRERIFDMFYTTKERGTGLGLPLTQQIVTAHGGTIECVRPEGGGTAFELWFPA